MFLQNSLIKREGNEIKQFKSKQPKQQEQPEEQQEDQKENQDHNQNQQELPQQNIIIPNTTTKTNKGTIHCLTVIGQIEGHIILPPQNKTTKYEHVIPQLVAVEENENIDGLLIILNTAGGDVEAGLAIAEMISTMKKPTVSLVLGGGHSIGVPLAVSAKYSFIAMTATMTIHPIRMNGMVVGVPQTYNYFDKMQDRIVNFVQNNSKISSKVFRELCFKTGELASDVGSVLDGKEAVACGLIDSLGGLSDAIAKLYEQIKEQKEKGTQNV